MGALFLARADGSPQRFYSLSAQFQRDRTAYYQALEAAQKGTLEVTGWLAWFLGTLLRALDSAHHTVAAVLVKARFWRHGAAIAKCSSDTALRDTSELLALGVLRKSAAGGRSTSHELNDVYKSPPGAGHTILHAPDPHHHPRPCH